MDQKALEYTRSHYDKHSNQVRRPLESHPSPPGPPCRRRFANLSRASLAVAQYASTEEALRARAQGPGAPLKKFHNDIKRQLINRWAGGGSGGRELALPEHQEKAPTNPVSGSAGRSCKQILALPARQAAVRHRCPPACPYCCRPSRFAHGAGSLLDLACGRGGDIWKWIDAGITVVKGIDLSPGEIEEARKR